MINDAPKLQNLINPNQYRRRNPDSDRPRPRRPLRWRQQPDAAA